MIEIIQLTVELNDGNPEKMKLLNCSMSNFCNKSIDEKKLKREREKKISRN